MVSARRVASTCAAAASLALSMASDWALLQHFPALAEGGGCDRARGGRRPGLFARHWRTTEEVTLLRQKAAGGCRTGFLFPRASSRALQAAIGLVILPGDALATSRWNISTIMSYRRQGSMMSQSIRSWVAILGASGDDFARSPSSNTRIEMLRVGANTCRRPG